MANIIIAACVLALLLYLKCFQSRRRLPLPPGPKKLPIIGNLLDIPKSFEWITYHKWCKEFGSDIIRLDIAGTSVIVLDNAQLATELLERRSSIYSGRPKFTMIELIGWGSAISLLPYGDLWRHSRRLLHREFHPDAAARFRPRELKASRALLRRLLVSSDNLMEELLQMAGETIMAITYGINVSAKDDPYIMIAKEGVRAFQVAAVPGAFLVDSIPILRYVPDWMPFAGFKRQAKHSRKLVRDMLHKPYDAAKHDTESGNATTSFVSSCLQNIESSRDSGLQEDIIRSTAWTMYGAGSDTTVSAIATGILGLLTNPLALKKAQDEIDRVIGPDHLPTFDHESSLPYITAITKETMRWREVAPIALPHLLEADDEYNGYRLPKGSIILPNAWAMLHDEDIYPQPFEFNPDRWIKDGKLDPDMRDPMHAAFGFGRRVCPGRFMAYSAVWITLASMIAAFDIDKARDANGQVIEPSHEYCSALVCKPLPFKCSITPRSKKAEGLIGASADEDVYFS